MSMNPNPTITRGFFFPNKRNIVIVTIIAMITVGAFLIGMAAYAQSSTPTNNITTSSTSSGSSSSGSYSGNCPTMGSSTSSSASESVSPSIT